MAGVLLRPARFQPAIFRLTYGSREHSAVGSWLVQTLHCIARDKRVETFDEFPVDKAPVYAARNVCAKMAHGLKATHLCMIDADMVPDCLPGAPIFWQAAADFALAHDGPCVVSAPTPMANGCVNVLREEVDPDGSRHLRLLSLDEAANKKGLERVPATGAGLILIDMRAFDRLQRPYFSFGYTDDSFTDVAVGEDVGFTARCTEAGVPVYAAWDCWAGHDKSILLRKPRAL